MAVIERDLDALVGHLRWPTEHRKRIRTTNLHERTFVEVRRRTKVIGRFPGETSALSPIWAVLELSSRGGRGVVMTPQDRRRDRRIRRQQNTITPTDTEEAAAAWHPQPAELRPSSPGKCDATARPLASVTAGTDAQSVLRAEARCRRQS